MWGTGLLLTVAGLLLLGITLVLGGNAVPVLHFGVSGGRYLTVFPAALALALLFAGATMLGMTKLFQ